MQASRQASTRKALSRSHALEGLVMQNLNVKCLFPGILDHLNPDDVRALVMSEDELATSQRFTRIFPNVTSHKYFK